MGSAGTCFTSRCTATLDADVNSNHRVALSDTCSLKTDPDGNRFSFKNSALPVTSTTTDRLPQMLWQSTHPITGTRSMHKIVSRYVGTP